MKNESGYAIGFSGSYYCLWYWRTEYSSTGEFQKYFYQKRISTDIDKVKELYPDYPIQMDLHGRKWMRTTKKPIVFAPNLFPNGRLIGADISTCDDIKALWALYLTNREGIGRNRVYARRRLVELGHIVRYANSKSNYCSPAYAAKLEAAKVQVRGLFYNNGERVDLAVKKVHSFSYESQWGIQYVVEYVDTDNRVFKYKGNTPPYFENQDDFTSIKATIKHGNYKGQDETLIQRIQVLNPTTANV
jgi:hypothetical protein